MQPLYYAMEHNDCKPNIHVRNVRRKLTNTVRCAFYYDEFTSSLEVQKTEIYDTEMPGGQYTNLQITSEICWGCECWNEVKQMY